MIATGGRVGAVALVETAAAVDGNFEGFEVTGRDGEPTAAAVKGASFRGRPTGADALDAVADELLDAGGGGKAGSGEGHAQGEDVRRVVAGIHRGQGEGTANQQRGADEEYDGEGDFAHDENVARAVLAGAAAAAAGAFFEAGDEVGPGGAQGGDHA